MFFSFGPSSTPRGRQGREQTASILDVQRFQGLACIEYFLCFKSVFIEVYLLYNVVLVSVIQQRESDIDTHRHPPPHFLSFLNFFPLQVTTEQWAELPVLVSCLSYASYQQLYMCPSKPPKSSPPISSPAGCLYVCSLRLCLYFCFANKIVCTVFLDSIFMLIYDIFFFWLILLCMTVSRSTSPQTSVLRTFQHYIFILLIHFKCMQILKGKHKCFHSLCFVLYVKQCKCCKCAKYYFFYFTIASERCF